MSRRNLAVIACLLVTLVGVGSASASTPAVDESFTTYGFEEIGPHSLLADRSQGVEYKEPACYPSFSQCQVYEFFDKWDLALTDTATAGDITGSLDDHGFNIGSRAGGLLSLTFNGAGTVWTGPYFKGVHASVAAFRLRGSDGSRMAGTITFLDDGLMQLSGVLSGS
jgi:hypothetical protein